MAATLLDGRLLRDKKFLDLKDRVLSLKNNKLLPFLVVLQVGNDNASNTYINQKEKACNKLGIGFKKISLDENITTEELKGEISKINNNPEVTGMILQLPLPEHINESEVLREIDPNKDADGMWFNFDINKAIVKPCTPSGIIDLLDEYNIVQSNKNIAVVGRSKIVGFPMSEMFKNSGAHVSLLHSETNINEFNKSIKEADIIILATGSKDVIKPSMIKENITIVDVGIIRGVDGKIRGDIKHKDFIDKVSYISPVPGGVGPMTIASLMDNVVTLAENIIDSRRTNEQ